MMKYCFGILILLTSVQSIAQEFKVYDDRSALALLDELEATPFERTTHPDAQWFPLAGLGLFIHWGIHSVAAYNPSWVMIKNTPWAKGKKAVPVEEYYKLAEEFNPMLYDPEKWVLAAKNAGFEYVVLTTKHHDGYCLWPSKYGQWNTSKFLDNRDLLEPYVEACRKYDMKVGFYFSPRDWGNPEYRMPYVDFDYTQRASEVDPKEDQRRFDRFFETTTGQLSEILTRYGKIDLLWFDAHSWDGVDTHSNLLHSWLRKIQPQMVVNPRWSPNDESRTFGDYKTEEIEWGNDPTTRPEDVNEDDWWEFCNSWAGHWGYSPGKPYKDLNEVLRILVYARSFGGNYLLNIGPSPDGRMPEAFYDECLRLAQWTTNNRPSIVGVEGVKEWEKMSNTPLTKRGDTYYAHLLRAHAGIVKIKSVGRPLSVEMLEDGYEVAFEYNKANRELTIEVPDTRRLGLNDVLKIDFEKISAGK